MAKLKVSGSASGTGTITLIAPATSTDRTITLPDVTSTLATSENFLSTGIDDNATAVKLTVSDAGINVNGALTTLAIKEDDSGNVGIGVVPESWQTNWTALQIGDGSAISSRTDADNLELSTNAYYDSANTRWEYIGNNSAGTATQYYQQSGTHVFRVAPSGSADAAITWTNALTIKNDGRGLSKFTAKAWAVFHMTGTPSLSTSHNFSSISDISTGQMELYFTNNMATSYGYPSAVTTNNGYIGSATAAGTNKVNIKAGDSNWTAVDINYVQVIVFGD
jgi:hypothetical protein